MDNVTFVEFQQNGETVIHAIIDRGNNEFTSMPKAHYDELQAQQDNPIGGTK